MNKILLISFYLIVGFFTPFYSQHTFSLFPDTLAKLDLESDNNSSTRIEYFKGKVILVNLWAIWCGPCGQQMPELEKLSKKYTPGKFEIIGVNIGDNTGQKDPFNKIDSYAKTRKISFRLVRGPEDFVTRFYSLTTKLHVVPQTVLIDRDGYIRGLFVGGGLRLQKSIEEAVTQVIEEDNPNQH